MARKALRVAFSRAWSALTAAAFEESDEALVVVLLFLRDQVETLPIRITLDGVADERIVGVLGFLWRTQSFRARQEYRCHRLS